MKTIYKVLGMLIFLVCWSSCTKDLTQEEAMETGPITRSAAPPTTDYYWHKGEKIGLNKDESKRYILFEASDETQLAQTQRVQYVEQPQILTLSATIRPLVANATRSGSAFTGKELKWAVITTGTGQSVQSNILYEAPFYTLQSGKSVGLSHLFYVKLKSTDDSDKLIALAAEKNVEILGNNEFMPLWYTLACTSESAGNALEMANFFYESGKFASCQPDLMMGNAPETVNDTYFSQQWNLEYDHTPRIDINYLQARTITTGKSTVIVAVLDEGVDHGHEDLPNAGFKSYDAKSGTQPSVVYGSHGTACGGIIGAASNNSRGVAGIASGCKLMDMSVQFRSVNTGQYLADGLNWAWRNGAWVISNSWGGGSASEIIQDAIYNALTFGREGKGTVVVFSSGNDNNAFIEANKMAYRDVIVVGATNKKGKRVMPPEWNPWQGSCYGDGLDVMAPGISIPSTDRMGSPGYYSSNYTMDFGGTSAACPHVAGVAGLILSINPDLTQKEVGDIVDQTARKLAGYSYKRYAEKTNGLWNNETGYGLVDAYAAVLMAQEQLLNKDVYVTNQTISNLKSFLSYKSIFVENVTVLQGGSLVLNAGEAIQIDAPFTVASGATLTMQLTN